MITQQLYLTAVLVRPGWSVRIKMKIKIQEDDVMWFEGSGLLELMREMECRVNYLLRKKGVKQCILEGYYGCIYWTWDYDTVQGGI